VNVGIQEGDATVFLYVYGDLYIVVGVVEVTVEVIQPFPAVMPDHEGVVHVSEQTEVYG
jgi:hypothetical protein